MRVCMCVCARARARSHVRACVNLREYPREIIRERDARAVSHVHTSEPRRRCSCNCVCRLGMLEVVWRRLGGRTRCLVSLFFLSLSLSCSVSLAPFRPLSPSVLRPVSLPRSLAGRLVTLLSFLRLSFPRIGISSFFLPLTHFIWSLPVLPLLSSSLSLSLPLSLRNPRWDSLSLLPRGEPDSILVVLCEPSSSYSLSLSLCLFLRLSSSLFPYDCIFNLGRLSFLDLGLASPRYYFFLFLSPLGVSLFLSSFFQLVVSLLPRVPWEFRSRSFSRFSFAHLVSVLANIQSSLRSPL